MRKKIIVACLSFFALSLSAQEVTQWRGTDRTGIYNETGLLKSWPADGPKMLWENSELGQGHSSVAIANNKIYITGMVDGNGHVFVFDMSGKLLNKKAYGPEWDTNFHGSRATVTIDNGKLYIYSGRTGLFCMDQNSLNILWQKDLINDFQGSNLRFGVNESPLIVGEKVIVTPGGKEHNVIALNKNTGDLIWSCAGQGDLSAYCSPLYIGSGQVPQVVTITGKHILGIDAQSGKMLWSFPYNNNRDIHPNTPIYSDNMLLCIFGYGKGSVMLRFADGGRKVEQVWENPEFDSQMGSAIKVGNYVYGAGHNNKYWFCVDWKTGETKYKDNSIGVGNVIAADGMLYCYTEKGEMALVKPTPDKFDKVSQFPITLGTEQHWAHPVIYKGVMYLRHGSTLMAFNVKQ